MFFKKIRKENEREKEVKSRNHLTQVGRGTATVEEVKSKIWPTVLDSNSLKRSWKCGGLQGTLLGKVDCILDLQSRKPGRSGRPDLHNLLAFWLAF